MEMLEHALRENSFIGAFAFVGIVMFLSSWLGRRLTCGRVHGSAIAIFIGLLLAYWGGRQTGGTKGLADFKTLSGIGLMGGSMMRDFTIVATAFEVHVEEAKKAGFLGLFSLVLGTLIPFIVGGTAAWCMGYKDPVSITTIGAGAIGASSELMALSIATGLLKAILVMVFTPALARFMGLNNPQAAMVFGGLAGTVSGVSAGLAATDRRLVPYGALVATFHTGFGCLVAPSVLFLATKAIVG